MTTAFSATDPLQALALLDRREHRHWRVDPAKIYAGAQGIRLLPVVLSELAKLIVDFPIVISKHAETGQFKLSALLGFYEGECLFIDNGEWQSVYVPLQLQRQPFFLAQQDAGGEQASVMIDTSHPAIDKSGGLGAPIFQETGEASALLADATAAMQALMAGEPETQQFLETLNALTLIEPMQLQMSFEAGDEVTLNGLYTINEPALRALGDSDFLSLRQAGYLPFIYTISASLAQIYPLIDRQNRLMGR